MQTVAMLGDLRLKSEDVDVKLTMKHSNPGSTTESDATETEIHSEESDIVNDPL